MTSSQVKYSCDFSIDLCNVNGTNRGEKCRYIVSFPDLPSHGCFVYVKFPHLLLFPAVFYIGDIIVSVAELQNLTFDQTADKEKQKSEAKHIQMQKQRALSDLFKSLAKTGEL